MSAPPAAAARGRRGRFAPLSLRAKATLAFAAVAVYFLGAGIVLSMQRDTMIGVVEELESLNRVESMLARVNTFTSQAVLRLNDGYFSAEPRRVIDSVQLDAESIAAGLGGLAASYPQAGAMRYRLGAALDRAREQPAAGAIVELRTHLVSLSAQLDQLSREVRMRHDRIWAGYRETYDSVTLTAALLFAAGLALFGGLATLFFRRLARDVRAVADHALDVVRGYRGQGLAVTRRDEVGKLMESVNRMQLILREREREIEVARQQRFHQEKMVAIGSLAAAVAHEINNPIAAIEGVAQSIADTKSGGCAPGAGDCQPEMILQHTRRIAGITRQLSELASPRSTEAEWIDVNGIAGATASFLSYDPRLRALRVAVDLDRTIPAAWGVADHVTQVLMNLLINAAHALEARPAGERRIALSTRARDGFIDIEVRDNGCGMTPEVRARAFDEGFTTKAEGSGIGLFMCKTLVERGGGHVALASEPGAGTAVTVSLPCQPSPGEPSQ